MLWLKIKKYDAKALRDRVKKGLSGESMSCAFLAHSGTGSVSDDVLAVNCLP